MKNEEAVTLIAESKEAVLATLEEGKPFTSAVNYFYVPGEKFGKLYLLMSDLARHTQNAKRNSQVSLMILEDGPAPVYERKRVSAQGALTAVKDSKALEMLKARYLKIFPRAEIFFMLPDFHFYEMELAELYFIGGFGKIESFKCENENV